MAMMQSRSAGARATNMSMVDRRAKAESLRAMLATRQFKFLMVNGHDQVLYCYCRVQWATRFRFVVMHELSGFGESQRPRLDGVPRVCV